MTYIAMAVNALNRIARRGARSADQFVQEIAVTADAIGLDDVLVVRRDLDRLVEILQSEGLAVPPTLICLGKVLGNEVLWQMAIDALGGLVMRRLLPRVVLVVHDVAVDA